MILIYEECKATLLNDASSRNNTPKHEAPLCARDWGINSNYFIMGPEGGVRTPRTPSLDPPLGGGGGGVEGGKGEGFEIQELRRDSPKWRSDSNFMSQISLHNRSNFSNPTGLLG